MTRRTRWTLIVLVIMALLVAAEVMLNLARGPQAMVQIENNGAEPIEDLVLVLGASRAEVLRVAPGAKAKVYLAGQGPRTLRLSFRQRGNALSGFDYPGFDPVQLSRDGFKLVLRVRPNEVERYQDDAEPATPMGWIVRDLWIRFLDALGIEPDVKTQ
jgi:hypothetical protein